LRFNFLTRAKTNGAGIFVKRLQDQFLLNGHKHSWLRPDVQLTISAPKVRLNCPKSSLVRVDGVYYDELKNNLSKKQNIRIKTSIESCDGLILQSSFSKHLIEKYLMIDLDNNVDYQVIHNGVPSHYCSKIKFSDGHGITCITCANWVPSKRLDDLIAGFLLLDASVYSLTVVGPLDESIRRKFIANNIRFTGPMDQKSLLNELQKSDVFVFTSYADNCPNAVIEALAVGLPVVCSPVGGTCELVGDHGALLESDSELATNSDGLIIPRLDPYDIADKIKQASRINRLPHIDFSIVEIAKQYEKFFKRFF
jgi:glycosyltransferase involved in cell wall biosynthesis